MLIVKGSLNCLERVHVCAHTCMLRMRVRLHEQIWIGPRLDPTDYRTDDLACTRYRKSRSNVNCVCIESDRE